MSKRSVALGSILAMAAGASALGPADLPSIVHWFGQSSLRIQLGGKLVWLDPVKVPLVEKADLILVTHDHGDHFSPEDIKKLSGPSTQVFVGFDSRDYPRIRPGDRKSFGGLSVEAVPAYNVTKTQYHPRSAGYCGYILSDGKTRIYDAGDTERIPEMMAISCDVAFLPLGQTYTMGSVSEAAQAALDLKARMVVPFHFGLYEGSEEDSREFARLLKGKTEVLILERNRLP